MRDTLEAAKKAKDDEFYTRLEDVELFFDLVSADYPGLFEGKSVVLPCDGPSSAFTRFFVENQARLGVAEVCNFQFVTGCRGMGWVHTIEGGCQVSESFFFDGDGSVLSDEAWQIISGYDFLFTNPPFSLYSQFAHVVERFAGHVGLIAPLPMLTSKRLWPLVKSGRLTPVRDRRLQGMVFDRPDGMTPERLGFSLFVTSIPLSQPDYTAEGDIGFGREMVNYEGLEFCRSAHVPAGYNGVFAVPAGALVSPMGGGQIVLHGVTQQWDAEGGERYRTYRFPGRQTIYRDGKPGGKGNWLNLNACYQIDGPGKGVCYEYDGAFYKLIFSRVLASWANK